MRIRDLPVSRAGEWQYRAAEEGGVLGVMEVRFSPFETWYEINSFWEGRFLERTVPGAFKKTAREALRSDGRYSTLSLFNHGMDFHIGDKILGVPSRFEEEDDSPVLEVPLLDTSYNRDLEPGLREGGYGSSFMFEVIREDWNYEPDESDHNPEGLPERTIRETRTMEAGPVTFPASPTATAGMRGRSCTDAFMRALEARGGSTRLDRMVKSLQDFRSANPVRDHHEPANAPDSNDESRRMAALEQDEREARRRRLLLAAMRSGVNGSDRRTRTA